MVPDRALPANRPLPLTPERRPTVLHLRSSGGLFGADRVVLDLCLALGAEGFRPLLVPLTEPGADGHALRERAEALAVPVRPLKLGSRFDLAALGRLQRLAAIEGAALLHTHDYKSSTLAALADLPEIARVATLHGRVATDWKLRVYESLEAKLVRRFDRVICVSEPIRAATRRPGFEPVVIPNGIDPGPFRDAPAATPALRASLGLPADCEVAGAIGRLSAEKGLDCLLEATARLAAGHPRLHILLVGEGPERRGLESRAAELGIAPRVHFLGLRPDVAGIYPVLDVFCMTSHREGLPIALLEALAAGRAAVVTPVGGIPDVIGSPRERLGEPAPGAGFEASPSREGNGVVALTVAPGDAQGLAWAIDRLLADQGLRTALGRAGQARVESAFSRAAMARATAGVYGEALARGAERRGASGGRRRGAGR
jgi:glycosyltransferase involved in cell wall biosynthesis